LIGGVVGEGAGGSVGGAVGGAVGEAAGGLVGGTVSEGVGGLVGSAVNCLGKFQKYDVSFPVYMFAECAEERDEKQTTKKTTRR
jgi:hypothetical protein